MTHRLAELLSISPRRGSPGKSWRGNFGAALFSAIWLLACGAGFAALAGYANRPGNAGSPPAHWPAGSRLALAPDRPTLVVIAHPHCPCTRATIAELERLMAQSASRLQIYILFVQPPGTPGHWVETDLWKRSSSLSGANVRRDSNGVEARLFHAETSGQVLLYDPAGHLEFHGGITVTRGHEGDNDGRSAILALLSGAPSKVGVTPVFGCPLFSAKSPREKALCSK